jgi:hypothetical protein
MAGFRNQVSSIEAARIALCLSAQYFIPYSWDGNLEGKCGFADVKNVQRLEPRLWCISSCFVAYYHYEHQSQKRRVSGDSNSAAAVPSLFSERSAHIASGRESGSPLPRVVGFLSLGYLWIRADRRSMRSRGYFALTIGLNRNDAHHLVVFGVTRPNTPIALLCGGPAIHPEIGVPSDVQHEVRFRIFGLGRERVTSLGPRQDSKNGQGRAPSRSRGVPAFASPPPPPPPSMPRWRCPVTVWSAFDNGYGGAF